MPFPNTFGHRETQTVSSWNETQIAESISYDNNHCAKHRIVTEFVSINSSTQNAFSIAMAFSTPTDNWTSDAAKSFLNFVFLKKNVYREYQHLM